MSASVITRVVIFSLFAGTAVAIVSNAAPHGGIASSQAAQYAYTPPSPLPSIAPRATPSLNLDDNAAEGENTSLRLSVVGESHQPAEATAETADWPAPVRSPFLEFPRIPYLDDDAVQPKAKPRAARTVRASRPAVARSTSRAGARSVSPFDRFRSSSRSPHLSNSKRPNSIFSTTNRQSMFRPFAGRNLFRNNSPNGLRADGSRNLFGSRTRQNQFFRKWWQ